MWPVERREETAGHVVCVRMLMASLTIDNGLNQCHIPLAGDLNMNAGSLKK